MIEITPLRMYPTHLPRQFITVGRGAALKTPQEPLLVIPYLLQGYSGNMPLPFLLPISCRRSQLEMKRRPKRHFHAAESSSTNNSEPVRKTKGRSFLLLRTCRAIRSSENGRDYKCAENDSPGSWMPFQSPTPRPSWNSAPQIRSSRLVRDSFLPVSLSLAAVIL